LSLNGQDTIVFKESLKVVAKYDINSKLKEGATVELKYAFSTFEQGNTLVKIAAQNATSKEVMLLSTDCSLFNYVDVNSVNKIWDKYLLLGGTYENLLLKGYQLNLRNELIHESNQYINSLENSNRFYRDEYLEDYLYVLINKIYSGVFSDNRQSEIYIKILEDRESNAFSLPNGCIIVSTGLLSTIQSEDELVGVLAHELAHFVLDHHIMNYNKEIDRKKRAEFWSTFATTLAAGIDAYQTINNKNHIPGVLTASTFMASSIVSDEIIKQLGIKYNKEQETEADNLSKDILTILKYNKLGLSSALSRIRDSFLKEGNYSSLTGGNTHPSFTQRIFSLGEPGANDTFVQSAYNIKVSSVNSYNAWIDLWYFHRYKKADELVSRNINSGVATEIDYLIKAVIKRRTINTKESNEDVLRLLNKAKEINVANYIIIHREEALAYLRLNMKNEAKKSFESYLISLSELKKNYQTMEDKDSINQIQDEIVWVKNMIFKLSAL